MAYQTLTINKLQDLEEVKAKVQAETADYRHTIYVCGGAGCVSSHLSLIHICFPAGSGRRIYWRGVSAPSELIMLYESVCRETKKLGFKSEKRRYMPHVTLIRK